MEARQQQSGGKLAEIGQRILGLLHGGIDPLARAERGGPHRGRDGHGSRRAPEKRVFQHRGVGPHAHRAAAQGGNGFGPLAHHEPRRQQQPLPELQLVVAQGQRFEPAPLLHHEVGRVEIGPVAAGGGVPGELLAGVLFGREAQAEIPAPAHAVAQQQLVGRAQVAGGGAAGAGGIGGAVAGAALHGALVAQKQGVVFLLPRCAARGCPRAALGSSGEHRHEGRHAVDGAQIEALDALQLVEAQQRAVLLAVVEQVGNLGFGEQQQAPQLVAGGGVEVERRLVVEQQRFVEVLVGHLVALDFGKQLLGQPVEVGHWRARVLLGLHGPGRSRPAASVAVAVARTLVRSPLLEREDNSPAFKNGA